MPGRNRTTKGLAGRIQWAYYKSVFPVPRWRRLLSRAFLLTGLLWVAWYALARNSAIYNSGPLTKVHASFGKDCTACHNQSLGVGKTVTDAKCQACHDGPVHNANQAVTPTCSSCHLEHRGREVLVASSNSACVNCHKEIHVKSGAPTIAASIRSFTDGHPDFAFTKAKKDPGGIKFNHQMHLKTVQLSCGDCHKSEGIDAGGDAASPRPSRAYMTPISYNDRCVACHPLDFDKRINEAAPHGKPEVVHEFLVAKFTEYIAAHPEEVRAREKERIPREAMEKVAGSAKEWVALRVAESERLLWTKTCAGCHTLSPGTSVPEVAPAHLTTRWFKKGSFNHSAHVASDCTLCHAQALTSENASDVMIPGIAVCQQCHNASWGHKGFDAGAQCLECHQYHDWNKEKDVRRTIAGL